MEPLPPGAGAGPDELLEFGGRRIALPRWLRDAAVATLVAGATAGLVFAAVSGTDARHVAGPARSGPPPAAVGGSTAGDPAAAALLAAARLGVPLLSYVRPDSVPGACALVPVGTRPEQRIAVLLRATLPGFRVRDVGRTLDQLTALCSVQLRAVDAAGTVLLVEVTAPQHERTAAYTDLRIAEWSQGPDTIALATATTPAGWTVTVGSLGPVADQPASALLERLAQDPRLAW